MSSSKTPKKDRPADPLVLKLIAEMESRPEENIDPQNITEDVVGGDTPADTAEGALAGRLPRGARRETPAKNSRRGRPPKGPDGRVPSRNSSRIVLLGEAAGDIIGCLSLIRAMGERGSNAELVSRFFMEGLRRERPAVARLLDAVRREREAAEG